MSQFIEEADMNLWQQPTSSMPYNQGNSSQYIEEWKGKYNVLKDLPMSFSLGESITSVYTKISGKGFTLKSHYDIPDAGKVSVVLNGEIVTKDAVWCFESAQVEEIQAGELAVLRITYKAQIYDNDSPEEEPETPTTTETWEVTWQSYSVNPYSFCAQDSHIDKNMREIVEGFYAPANQKSNRLHIQQCIQQWNGNKVNNSQQSSSSNSGNTTMYTYNPIDNGNNTLLLNVHEGYIMNKILQDKSAIYHYPIVTHRQSWNSLQAITAGENIDEIASEEPEFPFTIKQNIAGDYEWVKTADNVSITTNDLNEVQTTRVQQWWGVIDADINFYGTDNKGDIEGRWIVGKM